MLRLTITSLAVIALTSCSSVGVPPPGHADFVLIDKSDRTLTLYRDGKVLKTYPGIQLGAAPQGHKHFEGDERTPEGRYTIDTRNPASAYHLSPRISYPNEADRAYARTSGQSPGGDIFIHGQTQRRAFGLGAGRLDRRLHRAVQCRCRRIVGSSP